MSGAFLRGRAHGARSHGGAGSGVRAGSGRAERFGRGTWSGRAERLVRGAWLIAGVLALCLGSTALAQPPEARPVMTPKKALQKHDGASSRTHVLPSPRAGKAKGNGARFGVEPVGARLAMGGHLVAFRYRVVDAQKAKALFHDGIQPVLIDARTGSRLSMPTDTKMGALRASPRSRPTVGKQYYVLFGNPAGAIHHGSEISVAMGGCKLEGVVVQ